MAAKSIAKRHHTVPQFYLKGFARHEQISTVLLPGDRRFVQSVRKAASETHFYAIDGHPDGSDVFEKLLSEIEGEGAQIFGKIQQGTWPLPAHDRETMAYFIALQATRGSDQRRNMQHVAAQIARLEIGFGGRDGVQKWVARRTGKSVSDETAAALWEQATRPEGPPVNIQPTQHIKQMASLVDALLPYIAGRPWTLVRFNNRSLITSDVPVALIPHPDQPAWSGTGFMTAWGITFPLTRKLGLLMSDPMVVAHAVPVEMIRNGQLDRAEQGTTYMEKFFNGHTVGNASQWIYHHPEDGKFVPMTLPEPSPVSMEMLGGPEEFSGLPLFSRNTAEG